MEDNKTINENEDIQEMINVDVEENVEEANIDPSNEEANFGDVVEESASEEIVEEVSNDSELKTGKKRRRRRRLKFYQVTPENDIKYRGPLSYRHLRILGWLFFIIGQVALVWGFVGKADPAAAPSEVASFVLGLFGQLMMPMMLIATFATILNGSKSFKSMLMLYGGAGVMFYIVFVILHEIYLANSISALMGVNHRESIQIIDEVLVNISQTGYLSFNLFVDLFLCTLLAFFLLYRPKKVFVGKKLIIFRLFALLPILYEVGSFVIKMLSAYGTIELSPYVYPLLTTKPPMTFFVFLILSFFLKVRERKYRKKGGTHEQYQTFLTTRTNSWRFSSFTAFIMIVAGIIDIIVYIILSFGLAGAAFGQETISQMNEDELMIAVSLAADVMTKCGVGGCGGLILVAPIVLLFSYTRTHKNKKIDTLLPIIAIALIAFMYFEGFYHFILKAGNRLQEMLQSLLGGGGGA